MADEPLTPDEEAQIEVDPQGAAPGWSAPSDRAGIMQALQALDTGSPPPQDVPAQAPPEIQMPNDWAGKQPGFGDTGTAQRQADAANENLTTDYVAQQQAEFQAKQAHEAGKAKAMEDYATRLTQADQQFQVQRDAAHKAAAAETAAWMQDMDTKAKEEPAPNRWWENTSNFGKALWLMSLAFGTSAASKGGQNVAVSMMQDVMKEDVQSQKDRLAREMSTLKLKGDVMREDQQLKLTDMAGDHAMLVGRYNSLLQAAQARAEVSGSQDEKAAMAKAATQVSIWKTDAATAQLKVAETQRLRGFEESRADARQKATQDFQASQKKMELDYGLAEKLLTAGGKKGAGAEGLPLSDATGIKAVDANNRARTVTIPKEAREDVYKITGTVPTEAKALREASAAIRNVSKSDLLGVKYGADPALMSKVYSVLDPIVKDLAGARGLSSEGARDAAASMVFGVKDMFALRSIIAENPSKIADVLDQRLRDLSSTTERRLEAIPGIDLQPGERIAYSIPSVGEAKPSEATPEELKASLSGAAVPVEHPKTAADVREFGAAGVLPNLPDDLSKIVRTRTTGIEQVSPTEAKQDIRKAIDDVKDWESKQLKARPDDKAAISAQAKDALLQLDVKRQDVVEKRASEYSDMVDALAAQGQLTHDKPSLSDVKETAKRRGFGGLDTKELRSLLDAVNQRLNAE